jgi:CheY-like chemotaxis protein
VTGGAERILLVEDEDTLRTVTARMLREHGYEVVTACDGVDAAEVLERIEEPVDLVLTDVVMPRASGPSVVRDLRADGTWRGPVLFMSGYAPGQGDGSPIGSDAGSAPVALEPGERVLAKPFTEEALLAAVREVLDERR